MSPLQEKSSWPQKCFTWKSTPKAQRGAQLLLPKNQALPSQHVLKKHQTHHRFISSFHFRYFHFHNANYIQGGIRVSLFAFCLLKQKPTQKETICSYTKSVCFVHIAGLHSFNSNTNCQKHRYQTRSRSSCSGKEKWEISWLCATI